MSEKKARTEIHEHGVIVSTIEREYETYEGSFPGLETLVFEKGPKTKHLYMGTEHSHGHIVDQILIHGLDCLKDLSQ